MYRNYIKRLLDLLIGLGVLGLLWPVMGLMALAIYIEDPGPVLFRQRRLGLGGEEFTMLKFRSMKQNSKHTGSGHLPRSHRASVVTNSRSQSSFSICFRSAWQSSMLRDLLELESGGMLHRIMVASPPT